MINSSTVFYANLWINEIPVKKLNLESRSQYSRTFIFKSIADCGIRIIVQGMELDQMAF